MPTALRLALCLPGFCGIAAIVGGAATDLATPHYQSTSDYVARGDSRQMGTIRVYTYDKGLYVWPENLLPLVGVNVEQNPQTGVIQFLLSDGSKIILDTNNRNYSKNGKTYVVDNYELIVRDDHIQVSLDLLNRLLPKAVFLANRAAKTISVSDSECTQAGQWCRTPSTDCQTPQTCSKPPSGAPKLRSFIFDESDKRPANAEPDRQAQTTMAEPPKEAKAGAEQIDSLILQPRIKSLSPKGDFVEVFERAGTIFLPLNDVVQLFGFTVRIDKARGTASGYMFDPKNQFNLDSVAKSMRVGERKFPLNPQDVLVKGGDIYVSTEAFAKWFEVESSVDRKQQSIRFTTSRQLPEEESEERAKRWQKLLQRASGKDQEFPLLENPYRLIGYPVFDVSINAAYNHQPGLASAANTSASADYSIQGIGDLGYATGHIFMAGATDGRGVDTLRLTAGRKDPDAGLLGPLHATEFALGDIASPSLTLVTANSVGRGLMLTNRALDATENFDVRSFSGDAVPGYQAELYRNGDLLAFQTVGPDGRYNFNSVQILYGENVFNVVLYGPQGQKEERVQTIEASASLLKKNELQYSLGIDQRGSSLIPVTLNRQSAFAPVGIQAVAHLRYGITSFLTAGAFAAATPLKDAEHYYYGGSVAGSLSSLQAEATYARDITSNGWAAGISGMTSLYGLNLRAYYRQYDHFASESVNANDTPLASEMGVDTNAQSLLPLLGTFSYGLSVSHQTFENKLFHQANTYSFRVAKNVLSVGLTNTVYYADYPTQNLQDIFSLQSRLGKIDLRLSGIYQFKPSQQLQDLNFAANYLITDHLSAQSEVDTGPTTVGKYSFTQTLFWDFDAFRLGFFGRMDTKGSYSAGANLAFSAAHNPVTGRWMSQPKPYSESGTVAGRVYLQPDSDDVEPAVNSENARIVVDNATVTADPKEGYLARWITPYRKVKVQIDPNSIADPLLSPERKGYEVVTRPGNTVIVDFAMVPTTTIEGTVFILDKLGKKEPLKDAVVELEDKDGKPLRRIITEFDGYFSFDRVSKGEYRLGVPTEVLKEYKASIKVQPQVNITKVTEFISNRDIILVPVD